MKEIKRIRLHFDSGMETFIVKIEDVEKLEITYTPNAKVDELKNGHEIHTRNKGFDENDMIIKELHLEINARVNNSIYEGDDGKCSSFERIIKYKDLAFISYEDDEGTELAFFEIPAAKDDYFEIEELPNGNLSIEFIEALYR